MTIGQLADATGVNLETIRYYERIALMPEPGRTPGGHRIYRGSDVVRLSFIRRARELGFGIEDIRALLALDEPGSSTCAQVCEIAGAHLRDVEAKIKDLERLKKILADAVARCTAGSAPSCPVLEMLRA